MNEVDELFQNFGSKNKAGQNVFYCFSCGGKPRSGSLTNWTIGKCAKCKKQGYIAPKNNFLNPPK